MPIKGKANLGENFYPKLVQISSELGMKPEDLLAVMVSESGLNPSAYESKYKGSGLIGFMPDTLKGLGFHGSWDDFTELTGEQQLDYVKKIVQANTQVNGGPFTSAGQYYVSNLWPVGLKLPGVRAGNPNTPIIENNPARVGKYSKKYLDVGYKISADFESKAYKANPLFDKDKKGAITLGDMIKQAEAIKNNPVYLKALADMRKSTGYQPSQKATRPSSMIAMTPKQTTPTTNSTEQILDKYLSMISASEEVSLKRLYKKALPNHDILIQVNAPDHTSAVEFARVLCAALDEDLLATAYSHTDGHLVEIECSIPGPADECFEAVKQMTEAISETFYDATSKIGGIKVNTNCIRDKKSSYQPISFRTADTNHRKFLIKFI